MRILSAVSLLSILSGGVAAQTVAANPVTANATAGTGIVRHDDWRVTLTIFRSPGTGIQLSRGHFAMFVAHYPTAIPRDGKIRNTEFIRTGVAYYLSPDATNSAYSSLSFGSSLTNGWANSGLLDIGARRMFTERLSGQLGVAVLHAPETKATRLNPTVGLGVRF